MAVLRMKFKELNLCVRKMKDLIIIQASTLRN